MKKLLMLLNEVFGFVSECRWIWVFTIDLGSLGIGFTINVVCLGLGFHEGIGFYKGIMFHEGRGFMMNVFHDGNIF